MLVKGATGGLLNSNCSQGGNEMNECLTSLSDAPKAKLYQSVRVVSWIVALKANYIYKYCIKIWKPIDHEEDITDYLDTEKV